MVAERLRRLAPGRLSVPRRVWAIACWTVTAALAVVIGVLTVSRLLLDPP